MAGPCDFSGVFGKSYRVNVSAFYGFLTHARVSFITSSLVFLVFSSVFIYGSESNIHVYLLLGGAIPLLLFTAQEKKL